MTLWAIVPVKPLRRGKSRLAGVLSEEERTKLNRSLLTHTIDTLSGIQEIENVLVVSRDPAALSLARDHGARTILEVGAPHLNVALARATTMARTYSARMVLVLPADLPLITEEDICAVLAEAEDPPVVVIAPDHRRQGTNALLVNPAGLIAYNFGTDSFNTHIALTEQAGATVKVCELTSLAHDIDNPEDLVHLGTKFEIMQTDLNK
ncbi:MAG: 2-phospho-L-lactate guanylyltransferase [Chloroflexi bacterium]|nr:2-phospho-L-lactate guanylyltransferase [Chloroflexota bacterium]